MGAPWVIVGAGSAGCVVAARLSEDPDREVCLIEAGPDFVAGTDRSDIDGPSFLAAAGVSGRTYPDLVASRASGAAAAPYLRGRGVGGSSAINAMVALRGDPNVYRSWGWDDTDAAWRRVAIPEEVAGVDELGAVDRALLASDPDGHRVSLTRRAGRRVTSAEAYLWPAADRANLTVRPDTVVDRVVFDDRCAVGVALADGEQIVAERVVVAAGAVHTPAVLLRSHVDTQGVGTRLQDHPSVPFTLALRGGVPQETDGLVVGAIAQRSGIQLLPMNHLGPGTSGLGLLLAAVMTPHSRAGTVRLQDADPCRDPVVDFALLSDQRDVAALIEAVGRARRVLSSPDFDEIVEAVYIDDQGTTVDALDDPQVLRNWVASAVGDYVHASGSCAMGVVVDSDGAVAGYEHLYVCDASVFPSIPDVNTHLPTTMLAERLSARWRAAAAATSS